MPHRTIGIAIQPLILWQIRKVTFGATTCSTEKVCRLAAFLQLLPLPRLVHFLDMILPQMVPVQSNVLSM